MPSAAVYVTFSATLFPILGVYWLEIQHDKECEIFGLMIACIRGRLIAVNLTSKKLGSRCDYWTKKLLDILF